MDHMSIHRLERRIAQVIEKGFSRTPSPHEKSYDDADFLQMGFDVADMLLGEYFIDTKDRGELPKVDTSLSKALESTAFGLEGLAKALNEWAIKSPIKELEHPQQCQCSKCCYPNGIRKGWGS